MDFEESFVLLECGKRKNFYYKPAKIELSYETYLITLFKQFIVFFKERIPLEGISSERITRTKKGFPIVIPENDSEKIENYENEETEFIEKKRKLFLENSENKKNKKEF